MRKLIAAVAMTLIASGAVAQTRAYVSYGGTGSTCSQSSPCASIATAVGVAGDGGTVQLLTSGWYNGVLSGTGVNIDGPGPAATVWVLNFSGASKNVHLRNLSISGAGWVNPVAFFAAGGSFSLESMSFGPAYASSTNGLLFNPSASAALALKDVRFSESATGEGAAIRIVTGGQTVNVSLDNVNVSGGIRGIAIDTTGGGFARVSIRNSTFSNISGPAILATAGSGKIRLYIDDVTTVNSGVGISANGANVIGWIGETTVAGNNIGIQRTGNANLMSFKNNYVYNNNTDGTPLPQTWAPPAAAGPAPSSPVPALDPKSAFMASDN